MGVRQDHNQGMSGFSSWDCCQHHKIITMEASKLVSNTITVRITAVGLCSSKFYIIIYFIDWASKKELFIGMILRAYSHGRFNPQTVFEEEETEIDFTNKIEGIMKEFIIKKLAGDSNAIRKEVSYYI